MRGEPAAVEAGVTLQQPEACRVFSGGGCPWIMGPWQWWSTQPPGRGCVDSDLCLHTGFFWCISISFWSLVSALIAAAHACL